MPTEYKTANLDLKTSKIVRVNLTLRVPCPKCESEMIHEYVMRYPEKDDRKQLEFFCTACDSLYVMPSRIMNMRVVLAYDKKKIKEVT